MKSGTWRKVGWTILPACLLACSPRSPLKVRLEPEVRSVVEISKGSSADPKLVATPSGSIFLVSVIKDERPWVGVSISNDDGDSFAPPVRLNKPDTAVVSHGENSPEVVLSWPNGYVVWEEAAEQGTRLMLGGFNRMTGQPIEPVQVLRKKEPSMNGFPSIALSPDGSLILVWLDGRAEAKTPRGTFAVYATRSSDGGKSFAEPKQVALSACPCCRPGVAVGEGNEIYVVWRGVGENNVRDLLSSTSLDGGASFSSPVKVASDEWRIDGCPHAGPSLAVAGSRLYVGWRTDGPDGKRSRVRIAHSDTRGTSFSQVIELSAGVADGNHPELAIKGDSLWVAFEGRDGHDRESFGPSVPFIAEVRDTNFVVEAIPIGVEGGVYPQVLPLEGGKLALAWTRKAGKSSEVRFLRARLQ